MLLPEGHERAEPVRAVIRWRRAKPFHTLPRAGTSKANWNLFRTALARRRRLMLSGGMTDALSIARDLVRCPSVTPADAGALAVLENVLKDAGFDIHRVTFSEPGAADIDNLYARIGDRAPHISFAGHTDVVPAGDEAAWSHGAFAGEVKDGFLYGRGAVDMKGGIACSVAAVLEYLADNGGKPKGSISFLITGDEEDIAVNGTIKLLHGSRRAARNSTIACWASPAMSKRSATASRSAAAARCRARFTSMASRAMSPIRIARPTRCRISQA